MKKIFAAILFCAALVPALDADAVDVMHFLVTPSYNGESGFLYAPCAYVAPQNTLTMGLHNFVFKADYGILNFLEAGLNFDFSSSSDILSILKAGDFNLKARVLKEEDYFVSAAAGLEKVPLNIFQKADGRDFNGYAVISKKIDDMDASVGLKKNFEGVRQTSYLIADLSKVISDTILAVIEYDTGKYNAGIKISLNSNINVEFYIRDLAHIGDSQELGTFMKQDFVFGITYIQ
jgi:hypothetical protein